jgi:hypothetical protein
MQPKELAVVPKPAQSISLYEAEEDLMALLDSEALVTPEQEEQFQVELARAMLAARSKRDRVAGFIRSCEAAALFAGDEIRRLQVRKEAFNKASERLRSYVVHCIQSMGEDAKGELRKLEGDSFTMIARACPASIEIMDEGVVPVKYKRLTITLDMATWAQIALIMESKGVDSTKFQGCISVDKQSIKRDIEAGHEVPGADMVLDKLTLQIK